MKLWMVVAFLGSVLFSDRDKPSSTRPYRSSTTQQSTAKASNWSFGTVDAADVVMGQMYVDRSTLVRRAVMKLLIANRSEGRI